jgi:RNA polymerase sigma-70 factor (ECF subfamily)
MWHERTTAVVKAYLDALGQDGDNEALIRALVDRAVRRLHLLCSGMLHKSYRRLTQPPLNLCTEEMLSGVVERLLKALRKTRPQSVRGFFGLASQHMRWELNDLARRLDDQPAVVEVREDALPAPPRSESNLSTTSRRILETIERLPALQQEVFSLVHIQGLTHVEAAEVLGISPKGVQRHLHRALRTLAHLLDDLRPGR